MIGCRMEPRVGAVFSLAVRNSGTCRDFVFLLPYAGCALAQSAPGSSGSMMDDLDIRHHCQLAHRESD